MGRRMRATQHPSNNEVLGAPQGWVQDELPCSALPITRAYDGSVPTITSFWRPTAEELAALNAGALVALHIVGKSMPPAAIGVDGA